jgi:hypothetical protein
MEHDSTYVEPNLDGVYCEFRGLAFHDALEENLRYCWSSRLGRNQFTLKFSPLVILIVITLLLNNHIVHDHTNSHDLPYLLLPPCASKVPKNSPTRLEHTKFSLHILPDRLLLFCKHTLCLFYRFANCLHKCGLGRIDTIWEIVPFVIRVTIDLIGHLWSMSFYKPREKWRSMKHIDIIVRVGHAEERVSYPEIL